MEELCRERGLKFSQLSFDEQNKLWEEAKRGERDREDGRGERT